VDRDVSAGLDLIKKIKERHNLQGIYGPVYELFNCHEKYAIAVEETAGTRYENHQIQKASRVNGSIS